MKHFIKKNMFALLTGVCILVLLTACGSTGDDTSASSAPSSSAPSDDSAASQSIDFRLTSGHHTAGVDFPAGTYDLTAVQWCGRVSSSNGAVDLPMGTADYNTDGQNTYTQNVTDVQLSSGTVLSLSGGVVLRLSCDDPDDTPLQPRNQEITEDITLGAGNYTAGVDFPAGTYDLTATDGVGNVESSNLQDGGINDVMGTTWRIAEGYGFCEQYYQNVELPEGTTLRISGVELLLSPSE